MVNEWLAVGFPTARRLCQSRPVTSRLPQVRFGNLPFPHLQPDLDERRMASRKVAAWNIRRAVRPWMRLIVVRQFSEGPSPRMRTSGATARLAALRRSKKIPQSGELDDVFSRQDRTHQRWLRRGVYFV
jgi:hypothetical protein